MTEVDLRGWRGIVILDSHLIDEKGHHFPYLESIIPEFQRLGWQVGLYANRRVVGDVSEALGAVPYFDTVRLDAVSGSGERPRFRHYLRAGWHLIRSNLKVYQQLRGLEPVLTRPGTVILDPNCDSLNLLGHLLGWWLRARPAEIRYVVLIRRPLKLLKPMSLVWPLRRRWNQRSPAPAARGLHLATDSQRIRAAYPALEMVVLPIPHTQRVVHQGSCRELEASLQRLRGCRFLFLGRCRAEQGIATLVSALARLREEFARQRISAVIQAAAYGDDAEAVAACTRLLELDLPNVVLLTRMVSDAEYQHLLKWADHVLVPYVAEAYRFRTSGILAEALAAGRPVITTAETWMSDQVKDRSGLLFESGNPGSLASAIRNAAEQHAELRRCAESYAPRFAAFHNPARFVQTLIPGNLQSQGSQ